MTDETQMGELGFDVSDYIPAHEGVQKFFCNEQRLMLAVLEECLATIQRPAGRETKVGQKAKAEALEWVREEDERWPYSFVNICMALNIDVGFIRKGIEEWSVQQGALPRGIIWDRWCKETPYRVCAYVNNRRVYDRFETLAEAQAFHKTLHDGRKK